MVEDPRQCEASADTGHRAHTGEERALAEDHSEHVLRTGAERQPSADPRRAPHNPPRHQPDDADRRQAHREHGEESEQQSLEPADRERFADLRLDGAELRDRPRWIERSNSGAHRWRQGERLAIAGHEQLHAASHTLPGGTEDLEPRALMQAAAAHVAYDSDDCNPGIFRSGTTEHEALSDRVLIGPVFVSKGLVVHVGSGGASLLASLRY